jgi:hypothetical protein
LMVEGKKEDSFTVNRPAKIVLKINAFREKLVRALTSERS